MIAALRLGVVLVVTTSACTKANPAFCDEDKPCTDPATPHCDLEGEFGPANQCVGQPPTDAAVGPDVSPGGGVDAGRVDAEAADAAPVATEFDVAYENDITAGTEATFFSSTQLLRVANTGTGSLDLSKADVTNVVTDDPRWTVNVSWNEFADTSLSPGSSGGALSSEAAELIVDTGLMTEPVEDISQGYLQLSLSDGPTPGSWLVVHVDATLTIDSARANLRFTMTASGPGSAVTLTDATRVSSTPL